MANNKFVALHRGVNVGGKAKLNIAVLKSAMTQAGFTDVVSYINSGNLIFNSEKIDTLQLSNEIEKIIHNRFKLDIDTIVLSRSEWTAVVASAPAWWGHDATSKHNLIIMLRPYDMDAVMRTIEY